MSSRDAPTLSRSTAAASTAVLAGNDLTLPSTTIVLAVPETSVASTESTISYQDTSREAAVARVARGEMLGTDTMHLVASNESMTRMMSNGEWANVRIAEEGPVGSENEQMNKYGPGFVGGWMRVFSAELIGVGDSSVVFSSLLFQDSDSAAAFIDAYAGERGAEVRSREIVGADSEVVAIYRDTAVTDLQYRSEALAQRGTVITWVSFSTNNSEGSYRDAAAYLASYGAEMWDELRAEAGLD